MHKKDGDNPHFWYNPTYVEQVADQITADYKALDSADAAYFTQQRAAFENALKLYHDRIASIKAKFSGQRVGATESIFVYMANALGLDLISPPEFMQAIAEGNDPPAAIAERVTARPLRALVISVLLALLFTWGGLTVAFYSPYPVGFFITSLAFGGYILVRLPPFARDWTRAKPRQSADTPAALEEMQV